MCPTCWVLLLRPVNRVPSQRGRLAARSCREGEMFAEVDEAGRPRWTTQEIAETSGVGRSTFGLARLRDGWMTNENFRPGRPTSVR